MRHVMTADKVSCAIQEKPILHGVSFQAAAGEFIGLLGINGAGKSTLLDVLAGLRRADSGAVTINRRPLHDMSAPERARLICHLPQGVRNELPFTVEQIVLMGRYAHADAWMESADDLQAVERALSQTHCGELRLRRFSTLSGGERQRVVLAACLAQNASFLLMDEPSTYLDLHHQLHCFELLRSEARRGAVCIAVTHDLNLALAHCSRIMVLHGGSLEADMPVSDAWLYAEWLATFSERLRVEQSLSGASWVAYR